MKFFVYNAAGLTIPVDAEPGLPFKFHCSEEECGKVVVIEGIIRNASEEEFNRAVKEVVDTNPSFAKIEEVAERAWVFDGKVNGKDVVLPVESFDGFAKRFLDEVLVIQ